MKRLLMPSTRALLFSAPACALLFFAAAHADQNADEIVRASGVKGGLVVHLGSTDGALTAAFRIDDRYLMHGLMADAGALAKARHVIRSGGFYGPVSVRQIAGPSLPYADNLVNLLLAENPRAVPMEEILRVLAPGGVVLVKEGNEWRKTVKPVPDEIDEWTHHYHDADCNPVARDRVVGPPRHLQWTAGPLWARNHGWTPSVTAMVSAGGRVFSILDEAVTGAGDALPNRWVLVARDAFNGVLLWKREVKPWGSLAFSGIPDTGAGVGTGRFTMPPHAGKRLVAIGDTVYVTLGANHPVSALDAATGKTKTVYKGTENADEILFRNGRLILAVNPPADKRPPKTSNRQLPAPPPGKEVWCVDATTGKILWKRGPFVGVRSSLGQDPFGRLELLAGAQGVALLTQTTIECLSIETGEHLWKVDRPALPKNAVRKLGFSGMFEFLLPTMVSSAGVLVLAQPEPDTHHTYHTMPGSLYAFDMKDGRRLWKRAYGGWGHCTQPDVYIVDNVVWAHVNADPGQARNSNTGKYVKDTSKVDYRIQALDLKTGKLLRELPTKDLFDVGHHHRCYRSKSTECYLLVSRRGVELVDLETGENFVNHWVRSGCLLGNLPCNGLLYVTPHPCSCYSDAMLKGFNALYANRNGVAPEGERLEKGPAFGSPMKGEPGKGDWPAWRHDAKRSGAASCELPTELTVKWTVPIGGRPGNPVVANGRVFVADVDGHLLHALDAKNGSAVWNTTVDGRLASPPTWYKGRLYFGSMDGRVHALRATDGELVWRFRAAPQDSLICAFGQLESPWPVPGVLVREGECWFAAGRSSYLDGGIHVFALDTDSGKVLRQETHFSPDRKTGKMKLEREPFEMEGLLNDIPGSDGKEVFIRERCVSSKEPGEKHLYATAGFLDETGFNRTFWYWGGARSSGLMVLGEEGVFAAEKFPNAGANTLFRPGGGGQSVLWMVPKGPVQPGKGKSPKGGTEPSWQMKSGIQITAMIRAGDRLFVAGFPDEVDPKDPYAAYDGRKGGRLMVLSTANGKKLSEMKLAAPPVWDGMAAAAGTLYVSLTDGTLVCLGKP